MKAIPRTKENEPVCFLRPRLGLAWLATLLVATSGTMPAATVPVVVDRGFYNPADVTIQVGDTVEWTWVGDRGRSVTSGTPGNPTGLFDSGIRSAPYVFSYTFTSAGRFDYYCRVCVGLEGVVFVVSANATAQPLNVSTRMRVETGDDVLIGGFIVLGTEPKRVVVRAIGPSLSLPGKLANPTLELVGPGGSIALNDDWRSTQEAEIIATTVAPTNDLESAIVATLPAASNGIGYTAIVRGASGGTGVGLVEVYDLNQATASRLANISTRGSVQTGDNVMIGGFILGGSANPTRILARALGPSLAPGVSGALANPTLELRDSQGMLVRNNDDWRSDQAAEIQATGIPPTNDLESALVATLAPGAYTAVMAGKNGGTGVGLVEIYQLQ